MLFRSPMSTFGVTDVQVALGALIKKLAAGLEPDLGLVGGDHGGKTSRGVGKSSPKKHGDIPGPVLGGVLVASVASDVGLQRSVTKDQATALRVGVGIGTDKPAPGRPEPSAVKKLRRTLVGLAEHIRALKD